jgi:hypothetical protein
MPSKENVIHNLATKEIHSIMGSKPAENARSFSCAGKFQSQKAEQYYRVRYQHDFTQFLDASANELRRLYREYPTEYSAKEVSAQEDLWEIALRLHNAIVSNDVRLQKHRQNKVIHNLYENFYKLESQRCISRSNFVSIMKELFKYAEADSLSRIIGMSLDTFYGRFDALGKDCFNWRRFLFYIHFASHPTLDCRQQLLHAFSFIASHDGLDHISAKACIDLKNFESVLFPLVRADIMQKVMPLIDEAWSSVMALSADERDGRPAAAKITVDLFETMLRQKCIIRLFDQSPSKWGRFKAFPVFVSTWEEEFYNERLLRLVKEKRTNDAINEKLKRDGNRMKHHVWKEWVAFTLHQRSLRAILNLIDCRIMARLKNRGLASFWDWVQKNHAALVLQRVSRGVFGRMVATGRWRIKRAAIMIQCCIRMYFAKTRLHELASVYQWALMSIQRVVRGALGRRLAFRKLVSLVEREHLYNMREKERLLMLRGVWALTLLQASFRRIRAARFANELRAMRQRERDIQHAMEARCEAFLKERKVYRKQLEQYYRSKKEEHLRDLIISSKVEQNQVNIRTLQRRLKNDELKNAQPDNTEFILTEKWKREWEMKIEEGVEELKLHCSHCLRQPDNRSEKKIKASVKKRIKSRLKEVLARAEARKIPIETKEASKIATDEIIHIIGEEERVRLRAEMEKAFVQREKDKEEARLQAEAKRNDDKVRATAYAVLVVARACRVWLSRKELRRRCLEAYEKDYDEYSHRFYYRNKETNETSWMKPKAMGSFEMPTKDEWKLLRDAHNFPYYFNAGRMEMQWNPPLDVTMCCGKVPHTWYREFPVRIEQCPNFAAKDNYCNECISSALLQTLQRNN